MEHKTFMNNKRQTERQAQSLLQSILQRDFKGRETDAIKAASWIRENYGLDMDWHPVSEMLDYLTRINCAQVISTSVEGFEKYLIN